MRPWFGPNPGSRPVITEIQIMGTRITLAGAIALVFTTSTLQAQQPAQPPATKSPAASLGIAVYPAKGQAPEQQAKDEQECYAWAQQQTGVDPTAKANTDSAAAASKAKADSATTGAAVGGAAKGAVAGVAIGAVAGDAGTGAAVGATAGAVAGRRAKKQAEAHAAQQGAQQATAQTSAHLDSFKKAMIACLEGRGYTAK
jgi:uncharacterized protein YcfJ